MTSLSRGEAEVFAVCIISGIFSGILFDSFKIIRRSFKKSAHFTDLCDGLFWTVYACLFIWWIFRINDGELRWFVFSGIILGASAYFVLLSRAVVITGVFLLSLVKKMLFMITEILLFPVKFLTIHNVETLSKRGRRTTLNIVSARGLGIGIHYHRIA